MEAGDAGTDRGNFARAIGERHQALAWGDRILTLHDEHIATVERGGVHLDQNFVRTRRAHRRIRELEVKFPLSGGADQPVFFLRRGRTHGVSRYRCQHRCDPERGKPSHGGVLLLGSVDGGRQ